jgi:hypothetical protein
LHHTTDQKMHAPHKQQRLTTRGSRNTHDQFETKCTPLCAASATRQHEGQARLRASRLVMTLTTRLERLTSACTRRAVLGRAVLSDALCYTRRQPATLPLRPPPSPRCREREPPIPQPPLPRPAPLPLRPRSPSQAEVAISGRGRHLRPRSPSGSAGTRRTPYRPARARCRSWLR